MIKNKFLNISKFLISEALACLLVFFILCIIGSFFQSTLKNDWEDLLILPSIATLAIIMAKGISGYYLMLGAYSYFSKEKFTSHNKKIIFAFITIFFLNIIAFLTIESLNTAIKINSDGIIFQEHHFRRRLGKTLSFLFLTPMIILVFGALAANILGLHFYTKINLNVKKQHT